MIAIILHLGTTVVGSWTVQDWIADPEALQRLADEAGCRISVVPLAKVQPLEPGDLVRRARAKLTDGGASLVTEYHPGSRPRDMRDQEYPL